MLVTKQYQVPLTSIIIFVNREVNGAQNNLATNILQNIFFWVNLSIAVSLSVS